MTFRDSSDDRKKKDEEGAKDGAKEEAKVAPAKKDTGKANGLPPELDPNFGKLAQVKKMKAHHG